MTDRIRVEIAFEGGQAMSAVVEADTADALERALADAEQSIVVDAEDGRYTVRLDKVVYVKRFARDSRVGFGA
ncbi:MAG: hypothetical protein ICV67_07850 [Thermoleophilia bacterium]|nr:hypothetical protein [Thermoleophilia bacterium]